MSNQDTYILPSTYFGPVQYYSRIISSKKIIIEQYDTYTRQTYRNRCVILGANGAINLSIPVKKNKHKKTLVKDINIDYDTNWQKDHYRAIVSAYTSSPFFEFYFDEYRWVFNEKTKYLLDLNMKITEIILAQMEIEINLNLSDRFVFLDKEKDLRNIISPKTKLIKDILFKPVEYTQVFSNRFGFVQNLSIIDLLFNTGPEAGSILHKSLVENK
ncbi:MAG: WbqC family protein [Bacteroidota bacterium]